MKNMTIMCALLFSAGGCSLIAGANAGSSATPATATGTSDHQGSGTDGDPGDIEFQESLDEELQTCTNITGKAYSIKAVHSSNQLSGGQCGGVAGVIADVCSANEQNVSALHEMLASIQTVECYDVEAGASQTAVAFADGKLDVWWSVSVANNEGTTECRIAKELGLRQRPTNRFIETDCNYE